MLVAFVVLSASDKQSSNSALVENLQMCCRLDLIPEMHPARFVVQSELPKLDSGKLDRQSLELPTSTLATAYRQPGERQILLLEAVQLSLFWLSPELSSFQSPGGGMTNYLV